MSIKTELLDSIALKLEIIEVESSHAIMDPEYIELQKQYRAIYTADLAVFQDAFDEIKKGNPSAISRLRIRVHACEDVADFFLNIYDGEGRRYAPLPAITKRINK